jgi:hypothetical protein
MPFLEAYDKNVYIPKGFFKSEQEMNKVLKYDSRANFYTLSCYRYIRNMDTIISNKGAFYLQATKYTIDFYKPFDVRKLTQDYGEL